MTFQLPHSRGVDAAIDLMIVDHHPLFRECLASALAGDRLFGAVDVAESGPDALGKLALRRPHVLLVGLDAPRKGALELTREVFGRFQPVKVLLLGGAAPADEIRVCLQAGARGFVYRDQSLAELRSAIETVAFGGPRRPRRSAGVAPPAAAPTVRELEVLRLVAQGADNRRIAETLGVSIHTVKNHIHNLLEKLGAKNRWSAVRRAREEGWLGNGR